MTELMFHRLRTFSDGMIAVAAIKVIAPHISQKSRSGLTGYKPVLLASQVVAEQAGWGVLDKIAAVLADVEQPFA